MRTTILALTCAALALPAFAQGYDHYDPNDLVSRARQAIAEGDLPTACVLLSRAGKLAPRDARVLFAWGDYEAAQNGVPVRSTSQLVPAMRDTEARTAAPIPPPPPAPWPAR
jgi:hypothetical protein